MNWRNRWTFWATVATVMTLVSIPSIDLFSSLNAYRIFLNGWHPPPLKSTITSSTPHETGRNFDEPVLRPVEFRWHGPKAKSVELVGDFNAWKRGLLKMSPAAGGTWSVVIPIPEGRHKYLFIVDGEPRIDETVETENGFQGRRVMVRMVK
ncbi:MAG: glycogen-binding domain-containing protein [Elusimicrobiota bacterium]